MHMKPTFLFNALMISLALPLVAAEGLKVEVIAPEDPVVIDVEALQKVAKAAEALKAYEEERLESKPDRESMKRLGEMAKGANDATQGIDLKYRITNTSDEAVTLQHGGDNTMVQLQISGPGAVDLPYKGMMTMEFRMGQPIEIGAGQSKDFVIRELKYGKRDMSRWLITEAGDYEVVVTCVTNVGGKRVELKSPAAKFIVKSK